MVQGKNLYAFKDIDFPLLKRAVDTWMSEANESINSEKERRNLVINGHSVTTPVSDMSSVPECDDNESEYPINELTNKSTSSQNRHSPQGKTKTKSSNKTNTKLASSKRDTTVVTPTPECVHFTPTLLDASVNNQTPLLNITPLKEYVKHVKTPAPYVTGRQEKLQKKLPEICRETTQEIDELLQHNISNSTEYLPATSSQCITGNSNIEGTPDCKKCEFLETYISYAERAMGQLQEEISRLRKEKEHSKQTQSIAPVNDNPKIENVTIERQKHQSKRKAILIADSMGRNIAGHINTLSDIDCYGSINPGATVERLTDKVDAIIGNDQPDIICLMAGTNNVGNGERPKDVINKIEYFVSEVYNKCPSAQVVVTGLLHRQDKPHLNKCIDIINNVLSRKQSGITFVDLNRMRYNGILNKGGLHMNTRGSKIMSQNIINAIVSTNLLFTMAI